LFIDPEVPTCQTEGNKIVGRLDGKDVAFDVGFSSNIGAGHFEYLEARNNEVVIPLSLSWLPRNLEKGVAATLFGDVIWVPEDQPGGGRFYCITHGEFGPVPADEQPTARNSAAFKFRIDGAYAEADCSGGEVEADLRGCILRNNGLIPANWPEMTPVVDAPECTPLTRRLHWDLLSDVATSCEDGAALTGMPNPTHIGSDNSIPLLQPLVPGQHYAMNLQPSAGSGRYVGEIWGQSTVCGPVDELLWVGELGDAKRLCIEFVPAQAHTQLLLVTRATNFVANRTLGPVRFCDGGSCGGTLDGQGASPGVTLTTVPGAYDYSLRCAENGTRLHRLGIDGVLLTDNGTGGSFEDRELRGAAFRMGPNEPWSDRWYCASAGRLAEIEPGRLFDVSVSGITGMPACGDDAGSGSITLSWNEATDRAVLTSSLAGISGSDLVIENKCGLSHCDGTIVGPAGTFHFVVRVDGDLGPIGAATSTVTLPIVDATWLTIADSDGAIALACARGGTIMHGPDTTEIQLTGVGSLAACPGTAATPSSAVFMLRQ
jgi:hypothetical protein